MYVCPSISELRFYGCCHPCFKQEEAIVESASLHCFSGCALSTNKLCIPRGRERAEHSLKPSWGLCKAYKGTKIGEVSEILIMKHNSMLLSILHYIEADFFVLYKT